MIPTLLARIVRHVAVLAEIPYMTMPVVSMELGFRTEFFDGAAVSAGDVVRGELYMVPTIQLGRKCKVAFST